LIPRSIFSNLDAMVPETIKAKDVLIAQLEMELRTKNRLLENEVYSQHYTLITRIMQLF